MQRSYSFASLLRSKTMVKIVFLTCLAGTTQQARASQRTNDLLIKLTDTKAVQQFATLAMANGKSQVEVLESNNLVRVQLSDEQLNDLSIDDIRQNPSVVYVQPNYKIRLLENYRSNDPAVIKMALAKKKKKAPSDQLSPEEALARKDNPEIPIQKNGGNGADTHFKQQWGMNDIGVKAGWSKTRGNKIIVAVIDTGVDYTHEDLMNNLWRNSGEMGLDANGKDKSSNGIDDDGNGYIDDSIGWDFVTDDNKPYDLSMDPIDVILKGGNPGHGTHCAGNVAAVADNGKGIAGVAPEAQIMALRFLGEKGEGDTFGAIKAIDYAVKMGAKVLSNSWGSEGEDPNDQQGNQALKDAITSAENAGVLFIAAAGNGHNGQGYNNDSDSRPAYPASYDHESIISVAAIDKTDKLGSFSNWGLKTVDIAAPGVQVFSTMVGNKYSDTVVDLYGIKATWDGTSMATPHVAGAAALYWSANPNANWRDVKEAIMSSAKSVSALQGKVVTGGKLNVENLMK